MNKAMISAALEICGALVSLIAGYIAWGVAPALAILSGWLVIFAYALRPNQSG